MINKEYVKEMKDKVKRAADVFNFNEQNRVVRSSDGKNDQGHNGSTYLYIRSFDGDNGNRPFPAGTVCWLSPDIQLFDMAGNDITATDIVVGKNYTVKVVVYNSGDHDCNSCTVDLFIVGQTAGLNGSTIQPAGIQSVAIPAHSKETVEFPFVATQDGHNCLFARAYSLLMNDYPPDLSNFNTYIDRHIGQRNLNMVKQGTTMKFNVNLGSVANNVETVIKVTTTTTAIKKTNLPVLKKYSMVKRTITQNTLKLHAIVANEPVATPGIRRIPEPGFIEKIVRPFVSRTDIPVEMLPVKQIAKNKWAPRRNTGLSTYQIEIPLLDLGPQDMVPLNIQVIDAKSEQIMGGISILVIG